MKIKDITEYGYYQDKNDKKIIIEAFADEEKDKEILSVMIWDWMKVSDGINFYNTDMLALNPENEDICDIEVIPINTKFKIVDIDDKYYAQYGASSVMYEDKLSNTEKLQVLKEQMEKDIQRYNLDSDYCANDFICDIKDYLRIIEG